MAKKLDEEKLDTAGIERDDSGARSGVSFRWRSEAKEYDWLVEDRKNFADILRHWVYVVSPDNATKFLARAGLDGLITQDDLSALLSGVKVPSMELTNFLCALVPQEVCGWRAFRNRGHFELEDKNKPQVSISPETFKKERLRVLQNIASSGSAVNTSRNSWFIEWLEERIEELVIERHSKPLPENFAVDQAKSIKNLAEALGISADALKGMEKIKGDENEIARKAKQLAIMLGFPKKRLDNAIELIERAWSDVVVEAKRQQDGDGGGKKKGHGTSPLASYQNSIFFLRKISGKTQVELSEAMGAKSRNFKQIESGYHLPTHALQDKLSVFFGLTAEENALLHDRIDTYLLSKGYPPGIREGEISIIRMFEEEHVGEAELKKAFAQLRKDWTRDILHSVQGKEDLHMDSDVAESHVDRFLAGMRLNGNGKALCITPDGRRAWQESRTPMIAEGEMTILGLSHSYKGGYSKISRQVEVLRSQLIQTCLADGLTDVEAARKVESEYIGMRRLSSGKECMALTPEALRLWEQGYHAEKKEKKPIASEGEISLSRAASLNHRKLHKLRAQLDALKVHELTRLIEIEGMSQEDAEADISRRLFGMRNSGTRDGMYLTQEGLRMLEERYPGKGTRGRCD